MTSEWQIYLRSFKMEWGFVEPSSSYKMIPLFLWLALFSPFLLIRKMTLCNYWTLFVLLSWACYVAENGSSIRYPQEKFSKLWPCPAISKACWCNIAKYLKRAGVTLQDEDGMTILEDDVANGDMELTVSLLWNMFVHLQVCWVFPISQSLWFWNCNIQYIRSD